MTTVGGGVDKLHVGFLTIVNSASHRNLYFDWLVAKEAVRKFSKKCVKKFSQTNQRFCLGGNSMTHNTVNRRGKKQKVKK